MAVSVITAQLSWEDLPGLFPGLPEPGRWLPLLQGHAAALDGAADRVRVMSVPPAEAVQRQWAESLEVVRLAGAVAPGAVWVDVGSGGGFPGLVAAIVLPAVTMHLVEPLQKRARLLEEISASLGLGNVTVHAQRGEEACHGSLRGAADIVTARAVAELRELLEYTAPFAAEGGRLLFPKGSAFDGELAAAGRARDLLGCELIAVEDFRPEVSSHLRLATFRRHGPIPAAYPRRAGVPAKRPL
ncbi:MAG: 16S rRNA (guanine(527)-N(7))-methyltransferase RsmG [Dehalococcoidia bacterium]